MSALSQVSTLPYALISPCLRDEDIEGEGDTLALVLSAHLAPAIADKEGAEIEVELKDDVLLVPGQNDTVHQLGEPGAPFDRGAAELVKSETGLLVFFMNQPGGMFHNYAVFRHKGQ